MRCWAGQPGTAARPERGLQYQARDRAARPGGVAVGTPSTQTGAHFLDLRRRLRLVDGRRSSRAAVRPGSAKAIAVWPGRLRGRGRMRPAAAGRPRDGWQSHVPKQCRQCPHWRGLVAFGSPEIPPVRAPAALHAIALPRDDAGPPGPILGPADPLGPQSVPDCRRRGHPSGKPVTYCQ
jgi:hypothetical protein